MNEQSHNQSAREDITKYLNSLNEADGDISSRGVIDDIAERFDVSKVTVQKIIAEWEAGRKPIKP